MNSNSLLQESILELLGVELDPQLIGAHSGCSEEHWVFGEVRGRRSNARVRVDHQLMRGGGRKGESGLGRGGRAADGNTDVMMNHPVISCFGTLRRPRSSGEST